MSIPQTKLPQSDWAQLAIPIYSASPCCLKHLMAVRKVGADRYSLFCSECGKFWGGAEQSYVTHFRIHKLVKEGGHLPEPKKKRRWGWWSAYCERRSLKAQASMATSLELCSVSPLGKSTHPAPTEEEETSEKTKSVPSSS